jgi:PQQ-dependent catabolism-associated CXXCW motif protein
MNRHPFRTTARRLLPVLALGFAGLAAAQGAFPGGSSGGAQPMPGSAFPTQPGGAAPMGQQPMQPGTSAAPAGGSLDQLMAWERQDMGVPAQRELHSGAFHGPTPTQIPGGQAITTKGLLPLLQQQGVALVFDVLGAGQTLPNAIPLAWAAQPGSFDDDTQKQLAQALKQATQGRSDTPLVFYCGGPQCWMSYNAALRAIRLGYRNVLWYRGGMEAWQRAGQQFEMASMR